MSYNTCMDHLHWETIQYEKENGEQPLFNFLATLPAKHREKIIRDIALLERYGTRWGMPHVRSLPDNMYELRSKQGKDIYRTFFFRWHGTVLVLTSCYYKTSQKMDKKEFQKAKQFRDNWLKRKGMKE